MVGAALLCWWWPRRNLRYVGYLWRENSPFYTWMAIAILACSVLGSMVWSAFALVLGED